jgi:glucoamylase
MEKYYNDAIIGNQNILASFTKQGEMLRLLYPTRDYKQMIDFFHVGLKINDSRLVYLHEDINNIYMQQYEEDTNILNTEVLNTYFNLKVVQTDYASIKENVLIRKYKFTNENTINLDLNFLVHSSLTSSPENRVSGMCRNDALIQYNHEYMLCTFSKEKLLSSQINNSKANIEDGKIWDKDYVGMSANSSISYDLGTLKPNETREFELYIFIEDSKIGLDNLEKTIDRIRKIDFRTEYEAVKKYWKKYVKDHNGLELDLAETPKNRKIKQIYTRTILLYSLLVNHETGGISAAVEIDENLKQCGGYQYCWPRDAVFITTAMDILKMKKEVEKFYKSFCKNTQSRNGMWEQRFFTDGRLAPCWGYQIDETASVIVGVYNHYKVIEDKKFLKDNLKMCEKAINFLKKYVEDIFQETNKCGISYDLWEEYEGVNLYAVSSIFASFNAMIKIYEELKEEFTKNRVKQENVNKEKETLRNLSVTLREYILKNFYDESKKSLVRNLEDKTLDISILGTVIPFELFSPKDKKILNTVERINMTLRTYTGGYKRFETDTYREGKPWIIATLWIAEYYLEIGEKQKAKECFDFVIKTSTEHGFLAEQINNSTMQPDWVIGLGWSHAMFIETLKKMIEKEIVK